MKKILAVLVAIFMAAGIFAANSDIRLNTVGYLPVSPKKAVVVKSGAVNPAVFHLRNTSNVSVFSGTCTGPVTNSDTSETIYYADFSDFVTPGTYYLSVNSIGSSPNFVIAEDVYNNVFEVVMDAMYLWRCGQAVSKQYKGVTFSHAACHLNDGSLSFVGGGTKDGTGGWHDAGDYGKYIVNTGVTMGVMFKAWEHFGNNIAAVNLATPAYGSYPKFLAELKYQTDWILKMQAPDGSVYHKLTRTNFAGNIMPENDSATRYFTPYSTAATADFAAMLAMGARIFAPYDSAYAAELLQAARNAWDYLVANPSNVSANLTGFSTGAYQTNDTDDRLWAVAELWETTGEAQYLTALETRLASAGNFDAVWFDWDNVKNLGMLTYVLSQRGGKDTSRNNTIRTNLINIANGIVNQSNSHGYNRPLGTNYGWGCNGRVARQALLLMSADILSPNVNYRNTTLEAINHLFGKNYNYRSYVTGLGHNPPLYPHHRPSYGSTAWPGYLVGGPNPDATSYVDAYSDYYNNEVAINWNSALIYAVAAVLAEAPVPTATATITGTPPTPTITPTVTLTPTITMTHTPLPSTLVYDGDTAGFMLSNGTAVAGGSGTLTEVTGGVSGNAMQLLYVSPSYWQEHRWELNNPIDTTGWTDIQFDVKSVSGIVSQYLMIQDWTQDEIDRVDINARAGGITSSWKTVRIPLRDLYVSVPSTLDVIRLINNYNQDYTVLVDNIYLVMVPTLTATPTITLTFTRTSTPTITNTATITETSTITQTHTITPTFTVTPTATITPTYIIDRIELNSHKTFPNPSKGDEMRFRYNITGYAKKVKVSIYTFAGRKFDVIEESEKYSGDHTIVWVPKKPLANGMYHYILELELDDKKQRDIGSFVVIRNLNNE